MAPSARTPSDEDNSPSPTADSPEEIQNISSKRKASTDDEFSDGPSQKNHHTADGRRQSNAGPSRRKSSSGLPAKDEGRLLKRKEQNRAAQRAFRERKEKHVKDLEDKVADLEAKNEAAHHENENLRDLLQRLQNENVALKQSSFSFSMPQNISSTNPSFSLAPQQPPAPQPQPTPKPPNPLDWSSLTTFDPSILNLLDDPLAQPTATDGAMQMDFGFGHASPGLPNNGPYTTIASNPLFMSFASTFDTTPTPDPASSNMFVPPVQNSNNFYDMNSLSAWPQPVPNQEVSFDDLFSGYLGTFNNDFSFLPSPSTSFSPVSHHLSPSLPRTVPSPLSSSSSSISSPLVSTPESMDKDNHDSSQCPKTKSEMQQRIEAEGSSPFAPPTVRKTQDQVLGEVILCSGSKFPQTAKSDQNIEVLAAWRSIISDPQFKNIDVNELCQEFTKKARCDGSMVVLEPSGVHQIFESLSKK